MVKRVKNGLEQVNARFEGGAGQIIRREWLNLLLPDAGAQSDNLVGLSRYGGTIRQAIGPSQLELHFHEMFLAIIHQLQRGPRLLLAIENNFWRNFPGPRHIGAGEVINRFTVAIIELE